MDLATSLTTLRLGRLTRSACTERGRQSRPSRSGLERIRTSTLSDPVLSRTRLPIPPQARVIWSGWARVEIYRTWVGLWFDSADRLSGVGLAHPTSPRPFFQEVQATTGKCLLSEAHAAERRGPSRSGHGRSRTFKTAGFKPARSADCLTRPKILAPPLGVAPSLAV